MMNDIMDDQKVECVDVDGNDTVKLWKFYTEDERKAMENGMWYLLAGCPLCSNLMNRGSRRKPKPCFYFAYNKYFNSYGILC